MSTSTRTMFAECLREARIGAGFSNRETATIYVPFSPETIGRHERNDVEPTPEDVIVYAEKYSRPDLLMRYCSDCPIGKETKSDIADRELPWTTLLITHEVNNMTNHIQRLQEIALDGKVTSDEMIDFQNILNQFQNLQKLISETLLWATTQNIKIGQKKNRSAQTETAQVKIDLHK